MKVLHSETWCLREAPPVQEDIYEGEEPEISNNNNNNNIY